jgi:hypothetical protein
LTGGKEDLEGSAARAASGIPRSARNSLWKILWDCISPDPSISQLSKNFAGAVSTFGQSGIACLTPSTSGEIKGTLQQLINSLIQ